MSGALCAKMRAKTFDGVENDAPGRAALRRRPSPAVVRRRSTSYRHAMAYLPLSRSNASSYFS